MNYFHWIAGWILGLAWLWRLADAAVGVPKIADISGPEWDRKPVGDPRVSIIVPACNEAADIEATLTRLLALEYDNYEVIAVNDRSTDRTGEIMDRVAAAAPHGRLKIIHITDLPPGWMGKPHAMWSASNMATGDWLLFTDADVLFKPDALRRALAYAESERADHLVLFPRMIMKHPGEKMMIAFFQTLFVFGHRPWKVADPKTKDHMGVGAFNMIRRHGVRGAGYIPGLAFRSARRHEAGQGRKECRLRAAQCLRRGLDFHPVGQRAARAWWTISPKISSPSCHSSGRERWPLCFALAFLNLMPFARNLAGARLGSAGIRSRSVLDVFDLRGDVEEVGYSALLLLTASREHGPVRVHHATVDVPDVGSRRSDVAGNFLPVGGITKRHGVAPASRRLSGGRLVLRFALIPADP